MTDERFDRDLRQVLAGIAGREAPGSLRDRIERMMDEAPVSRRLWFVSPMPLSFAAVAAVAVVALAIFFSMPRPVGPNPSESPWPTEPSASPTESPTPEATPSLGPSPSPTLQPTPTPIPVWSGLDWSSGPGIKNDDGHATIEDALRWGDGYVGVGVWYDETHNTFAPAFLRSSDGAQWTIVQQGDAASSSAAEDAGLMDMHLVATPNGLVAVSGSPMNGGSAPTLWRSDDGQAWSPVDSPTWQGAWDATVHGSGSLIAVAARHDTIVVLGVPDARCCDTPGGPGAIIVTSTDGQNWHRLAVPSTFDHAFVRDLASFGGGFVIVGAIGTIVGSSEPPPSVMGSPAAWVSPDGQHWAAGQVEGSKGLGVGLGSVVAGQNGLFAIGRRADAPAATLVGAGMGATSGWASADGRTWRLVGDLGKELPDIVRMAGDGTRMVILGRTSCKATDIAGWASVDGARWSWLAFSGAPPSQAIPGPICQEDGTEGWNDGGSYIALAWVVPEGVLITTVGPAAGGTPWFAAAVTR